MHNNICLESVLLAGGAVYLVGFGAFRSVGGETLLAGGRAWERELYRHPARQGGRFEDVYVMQHDIYSLGVLLLEIGLGETFVTYGDADASPAPAEGLIGRGFRAWRTGIDVEDEAMPRDSVLH